MSFISHIYKKRFFRRLIFILYLSGCVTTEYGTGTHRQDIFFYSSEKEVDIGRNLNQHIHQEKIISKNPKDIERISRIASKIVEVCDRKEINYYFYIIDEDEKNAFSVPGGYVYIYSGLMNILDDNELGFVIAHEVAHIVCRHSIKKLQAAMGMNLLILATAKVESTPNFHQGLSFALAQILTAYSREDEFNADELATKYLKLAGLNPKSGVEVLEKLYRESKKASPRMYSYFRTHPYVDQRIKRMKEYLGLPLNIKDYLND
ncbi:MAG: M48 family metalloprotease [Candidatus Omnitrophica bacterium]|nr:M48 family metalloprotease [Candidatus Omnitrophota bacterium]